MARAVAFIHGHDIRHKDLKPSQILLSPDDLWLTDFGWSRDMSELSTSATSGGDRITVKFEPGPDPRVASQAYAGQAGILEPAVVPFDSVLCHDLLRAQGSAHEPWAGSRQEKSPKELLSQLDKLLDLAGVKNDSVSPDSEEGVQQIVVSRRRRGRSRDTNGNEGGFFEDDCEVLDFPRVHSADGFDVEHLSGKVGLEAGHYADEVVDESDARSIKEARSNPDIRAHFPEHQPTLHEPVSVFPTLAGEASMGKSSPRYCVPLPDGVMLY
ncbi:hypothetical protein EK21DRAFT_94206 [Setomelanomma holmii]|uniref:Protein kinase domain-containing protein n=1 Tax=Setomelanomma holmii TaxID=210430 RepID=A0A9P4GZC1_9PLEO|nr:hypothetical protein EK21DRAFT_94206 [Setomelanomma holmii]